MLSVIYCYISIRPSGATSAAGRADRQGRLLPHVPAPFGGFLFEIGLFLVALDHRRVLAPAPLRGRVRRHRPVPVHPLERRRRRASDRSHCPAVFLHLRLARDQYVIANET